MFGTSGIRGIYGRDVTEALAMKVANVFAGKRLVVARDTRGSGVPLSQAVAAGALSAGSDVIDLGIAPTPTAALATKKYACRGIMITASHNPPEYNGLKLIEGGKEIDKETERAVTKAYGEAPQKAAVKSGTILHDNEIIDEHKAMVSGMVDCALIGKKKPRVIVDCNGSASVITPFLLSDLGCQVVTMNTSLEGFGRPSEPNEKNLTALSKLVSGVGADFGIAHDGDGDRCVIVDDAGAVLPLDVQLAIMIEHELEKIKSEKMKNKKASEKKINNKKIISTVEASLVIRDVVENAGGEIEITPVGSTYIAEALEASGAIFGGEPCGEYVYQKGVHMPDAVLAAAKFAEIFCLKGKFSKLKANYKQNFMARERFPAKDKYATVEKIKKSISVRGKLRTDDGIRVDEEDGWLLIRASGTEPIVRLTMEYKTKEKLEERKEEMTKLIRANL